MIRIVLLLVLTAGSVARAQSDYVDPDTQAAHRHFERGIDLYNSDRYGEAIVEFERANAVKAAPAFDYNIGRCYERLERWGDAADAYARYLERTPNAAERDQLRQRIDILRERQRHAAEPAQAPGAAQQTILAPPLPLAAPPATAPSSVTAAALTASPPPKPVYKRGWFWTVVGAGAAVVAAAVVVGVVVGGGSNDPSHSIAGASFR